MSIKNRAFRWWTYAKRGHSAWATFFISLVNFVVIQYKLVIENVSALSEIFPNLYLFAVLFVSTYFPVVAVIGWLDFKRGTVPVESTVATLASPWFRDFAQALIFICDGKPEEAKKILRKWTG